MTDCNPTTIFTDAELRIVTAALTTIIVAVATLAGAYVTKTIRQWLAYKE